MVHDTAQEENAASGFGSDVELLFFFIAHALVKDPKLASVTLLPVRVKVYNCLE